MSRVGARIEPGTGNYVRVDPRKVAEFVRDGGGPVIADLTRRAENVRLGAVRQVGKRTRTLERSIVKRVQFDGRGPFLLVVTEGVAYALVHHEGNTRGWSGNRYLTDNLKLAAR